MDFTVVDGGIAAFALVSALLAYSRGVTREIFAVGGWLIAAAVAAFLTPVVEPLMRELPGVGGFLASSCVLSVIAAFTAVMALGLLVMAVFTPVISGMVLDSVLGPIDRILGFAFGVARAALLVAVAFLLYQEFVGDVPDWEPLANAASLPYVTEVATLIRDNLPTELPPVISERIDAMMLPCGGGEAPVDATLPEVDENGIETVPQPTQQN
ncbi:MAG: CvpA family protein [Pseudomonadota bacterium]